MSNIRLYVDHQRKSGCPVPPYVTITDDHIRAIHGRMRALGLIWAAPDPAATAPPCCDPGFFIGNNLKSSDLSATPAPTSPVDDGLSPEAAAAIKRGCEDSAAGRVKEADFSGYAPAVDDEATVEVIKRVLLGDAIPVQYWAVAQTHTLRHDAAKAIVAAIRRGEVPGLPSPDEHAAIKAEVERLRAEMERERVRLAGCGAAALGYSRGDVAPVSYGHSASYDDVVRLRDRCEKAESERDAAIARAEKAERNCANVKSALDAERRMNDENRCKLQANLDTVRAAHAEAMGLLKRCHEYGTFATLDDAIVDHCVKYGKDASK